jgi:long-chain acyl-CoA synthetase
MTTLRDVFENTERKNPDAVAMRFRRNGAWTSCTWGNYHARVRQVAAFVGTLGLTPGRDHVALILENRPEWLEIYMALAGSGLTVVPLDIKLHTQEIAFILGHSEAVAVFASSKLRPVLDELRPQLPQLRHIILVEGAHAADKPDGSAGFLDFETAINAAAATANGPDAWYDQHRPAADDVASILYTSGTTGKPKGAMLTHANFCTDIEASLDVIPEVTGNDSLLVVLPFFHSFSFSANYVIALFRGACLAFPESLRTLGPDIQTLQPTIIMSVPLLIEKLFQKMDAKIRAKPLGRLLLKLRLGFIPGMAARKGLGGRLRFFVVGGAPCPLPVLQGLGKLGFEIIEGYGLTETSPVVSFARPGKTRAGTIGLPIPNIEVRLANADANGIGEIQVKGPIVMKGYFKDEAATKDAFDDGWFRTGDLASKDSNGYISIRGRKKALIVNREGKNIYPEEVELCIAHHPYVLDVVVVGYREGGETGERVGAIVVPNLDVIKAERGGVELPWPEIEKLMRDVAHERCRELADYKHPRKVIVQRDPLERTSTQKVRRHAYQGKLDTK